MDGSAGQTSTMRGSRLFGPIILMMLGGLVLLGLLIVMLIDRFDASAAVREGEMVSHGFELQSDELKAVIVPQVNWDDAVKALDHSLDPEWADFNLGNYLFTFNGFTRVFVVDRAGKPIYVAKDGQRSGAEGYAPFAAISRELIRPIRKAEAARPPIKAGQDGKTIVTTPIQAAGVEKVGDQIYLVLATLVQPDFGLILPRHSQAPVTITAMPIDAAMVAAFGKRYLLDDMAMMPIDAQVAPRLALVLHSPSGEAVGKLVWRPRALGRTLFDQLLLPLLVTTALLALLAWTIVRRGTAVVRELVASESRATQLAYHDILTRLPNRAMLFERLQDMLGDPGLADRPVTVLCVDLDRFKVVNDTLGHQAGDLLIERTASRLREVCGDEGTIARLGGDEFVVVQPNRPTGQAIELAHRILAALREPMQSKFGVIEAGASIGVAVINRTGIEPSEALRWADLALYKSKDDGRNRVTLFEDEMDQSLLRRRAMERQLRTALSHDELHMVYQPQVDQNGEVSSVEALLRWNNPEHGAVSPATFIPLAEEAGLINLLGQFVLRQVFHESRDWLHLRVAINISPVQLRSPGFAALVTRIAAQAGVDPARYEFEVTETALLGRDAATAGNIEALKGLGFSIALDDFGTGHSSLSVLQHYSVDRIKIDQSFVASLEDDQDAGALVDAIVKLAAALDLGVIAEGVETDSQRRRLAECGCLEFQGHLIGEPMLPGRLLDWMAESRPELVEMFRKRA